MNALYQITGTAAFEKNERELLSYLADRSQSKELRDIGKFAEEEIVLPNDGGPFEGQPFELERQPYVRLLYNEIMNGNWTEYIITGPSQSGKTLCAFVIPLLWILIELRKNCVCGVPDGNMIADKWGVDIEPVFRATPTLERYLPTSGPGSKGGTVKEFIKLTNGVRLRFMTAGGSDQSKAGFTATHQVVTEAAGFSAAKKIETSRESAALRQLKARQRSASRFDDEGNLTKDRQMIVEGTVTVDEDLPWNAHEESSKSKIVHKCESCRNWVSPEREHLSGWSECASEFDAARHAYFCCPKCGIEIDEQMRRKMVEGCKLLHDGQEIDSRGRVSGSTPETSTLWFRWSAFQNLFLKIADLGAEEWKCNQLDEGSPERAEAEQELYQQVWCKPYAPEMDEAAPLVASQVRKRTHRLTTGVLPDNKDKFVIGVDVGRYRCWYFGISFNSDSTMHCPVYGTVDTSLVQGGKIQRAHEKQAIQNALRELFDLCMNGWPMVGQSNVVLPDLVLVDSGYFPDAVTEVCAEYGRGINARFKAVDGVGKSEMASRLYNPIKRTNSVTRRISKPPGMWNLDYRARHWVLVLNADRAKLSVQSSLRVEPGQPGALTLPMAPHREHITVARQLSAEVYRRWIEPGKGLKEEWIKSGQNHLLDCAAYAWTGGNFLGWKIKGKVVRKTESSQEDWLTKRIKEKQAKK